MDSEYHFRKAIELSIDDRFEQSVSYALYKHKVDKYTAHMTIEAAMGRLARKCSVGELDASDDLRRAIAHADYATELLFR